MIIEHRTGCFCAYGKTARRPVISTQRHLYAGGGGGGDASIVVLREDFSFFIEDFPV